MFPPAILAAVAEGAPAPGDAFDAGSPLAPTLTLALCVLAGLGTYFLLPNPDRQPALRRVGAGLAVVAFAGLVAALLRGSILASGAASAYFWVFSAVAIASAARVVTHPVPVYASLYFVLTVLATSGLFVLLWAEFLAAALVVIYAGAILVTYTFVIMLAGEAAPAGASSKVVGERAELAEHDARSREPLVACAAGFATLGVLLHVVFDRAPAALAAANPSAPVAKTVRDLGLYLFTKQAVALQAAGLVLTLAMVGAILLARHRVVTNEAEEDEPEPTSKDYNRLAGEDNPHAVLVEGSPSPRIARERVGAEF